MATGHFPNCSHNFEWYGLINHDRMITLTLQNKYDTTLPSVYPKFAYPLQISLWIRNLFTHGQTLPGRFAIGSETIDRRFGVVYRDVITGSRESLWRSLIHRILKSLLPQNNTFFITTASVVKDAADDPDCQGLREQWYYLRFYVRRTMPPTVSHAIPSLYFSSLSPAPEINTGNFTAAETTSEVYISHTICTQFALLCLCSRFIMYYNAFAHVRQDFCSMLWQSYDRLSAS